MKKEQEENQEEKLTIPRSQSFIHAEEFAKNFAKTNTSIEVKMVKVKPVQGIDKEPNLYYKGIKMAHLKPRDNHLFGYTVAGEEGTVKVDNNTDIETLKGVLNDRMETIDANISDKAQKQTEKVDKARSKA